MLLAAEHAFGSRRLGPWVIHVQGPPGEQPIACPGKPFAALWCPRDVAARIPIDEMRRVFDEHYREILGAVTLVTGSRAVAEDSVNEAIARAWERGEGIQHLNLGAGIGRPR